MSAMLDSLLPKLTLAECFRNDCLDDERDGMNITLLDKTRLRKAYERAIAAGADSFWYGEHLFSISYAEYLLDFLEGPAKV